MEEEIFDDFRTQLADQLPMLGALIPDLSSLHTYKSAVHDLFRMVHSYKAIAIYLKFEAMARLLANAEDLLNELRSERASVKEATIDWLLAFWEQMGLWSDEMHLGQRVLSPPSGHLSGFSTGDRAQGVEERLRELTLLYIDPQVERGKKMVSIIARVVREAFHAEAFEALQVVVMTKNPHIILVNADKRNLETIEYCKAHFPDAALIVAFEKLTAHRRMKLSLQGINHVVDKPIRSEELKRELYAITFSHFTKRRVIINHQKIYRFIQNLTPLPQALIMVQQICDDPETPIKELIRVVRQDPVMSGVILDAANQPIYGLKNVVTIDQAVAAFGKRTVKALVLGMAHECVPAADLSACGINEALFKQIVSLRLALMMRWYAKVSVSALGVLSSCAVLGNIGQLLIAQEIARLGAREAFSKQCQLKGAAEAVYDFLQTSVAFVSSDIVRYWQLNPMIIDVIRYSDEPSSAPQECSDWAWAAHAVFSIVGVNGVFANQLDEKLYTELQKRGLNPDALDAAMETLELKGA